MVTLIDKICFSAESDKGVNVLHSDEIKELEKKALQLRYDLVEMIGVGIAGHLGGSSSLAELMAVLYFHK